jgi:signal transduction histidine kinase
MDEIPKKQNSEPEKEKPIDKLQNITDKMNKPDSDTRIIDGHISEMVFHLTAGELTILKPIEEYAVFQKIKPGKKLSVHSVFDKKLAGKFTNAVKKCMANGSFEFEFDLQNNENNKYYEVSLIKLETEKTLVILRDVTEINRIKKELQEAKMQAEDPAGLKSEFLGNLSHEIRTPLNAILGFSQWLVENTSDKKHREYLTTILRSSRSLLNLLNDILEISKIDSGKIEIDNHPMNYHEVINDIKLVFQQKTEQKGISLKITTDASVPGYIFMDELRFYQIVFNLVSNAVRLTSKGTVHLSARAEKTKRKDEINLLVIIEDTGIGIKINDQKNIFDTLLKESAENNRLYEGTGLGLAIVYRLLKKLNGTISLKSQPGKGSVYTVTFNNVKVAKSEVARTEPSKGNAAFTLEPCTIMIADDIIHNILVLKQLINSEKVSFVEARDGTDALAKLKTVKPDLIFMDIRMPGISGFDATELIKKDPILKHIPVIAFTASTIKDHNSRINSLFDGFLQKPVFKKELDAVLKRFLRFSYAEDETRL